MHEPPNTILPPSASTFTSLTNVELENLVIDVYDQLKQIARGRMAQEGAGHTLQATALVGEAYLRLAKQKNLPLHDQNQFLAIASNIIRRVLIDHARAKKSKKRGGNATPVALVEEIVAAKSDQGVDVLALGEAIEQLESLHPRATQVIEMRFFGGHECNRLLTRCKFHSAQFTTILPSAKLGCPNNWPNQWGSEQLPLQLCSAGLKLLSRNYVA